MTDRLDGEAATADFDARWTAHLNDRTEALRRQSSSSESFDKAILTYSSGGLALSLTIIKDLIPIAQATASALLYTSWFLFTLAITLTTVSFLLAYKANETMMDYSYKFHVEDRHEYLNKSSICNRLVVWGNYISAVSFILAVGFTALFVGLNLKESNRMATNKVIAQDGLPTAMMNRPQPPVMVQNGQAAASMHPAKPFSAPVAPAQVSVPTPAAGPVATPAPK